MSLSTKYNEVFGKLQTLIKPIHDTKETKPEDWMTKRDQITNTFNSYTEFARTNYEDFSAENKAAIISHIQSYRTKLFEIFISWNINFEFHPDIFTQIDETCFQANIGENLNENLNENNIINMPISAEEFLRAAAQQLSRTYNGDPFGLQAFLKSIKLLQTLSGPTHIDMLKDFIMTRLDSKAAENVPTEPENIEQIIESLKKSIKPDSSKVIAGKMMALKSDKSSNQEFAKLAEKLAEDLKRSLIIEGISLPKANEMTTDKTVELCRANVKSDLVKSILASTTFENFKEVVAKFIVESATHKTRPRFSRLNPIVNFSKGEVKINVADLSITDLPTTTVAETTIIPVIQITTIVAAVAVVVVIIIITGEIRATKTMAAKISALRKTKTLLKYSATWGTATNRI